MTDTTYSIVEHAGWRKWKGKFNCYEYFDFQNPPTEEDFMDTSLEELFVIVD